MTVSLTESRLNGWPPARTCQTASQADCGERPKNRPHELEREERKSNPERDNAPGLSKPSSRHRPALTGRAERNQPVEQRSCDRVRQKARRPKDDPARDGRREHDRSPNDPHDHFLQRPAMVSNFTLPIQEKGAMRTVRREGFKSSEYCGPPL